MPAGRHGLGADPARRPGAAPGEGGEQVEEMPLPGEWPPGARRRLAAWNRPVAAPGWSGADSAPEAKGAHAVRGSAARRVQWLRRMNRSTALAKPSSSLDVVTRRAARWASVLALPIAMLKPEWANMSTSFGMSPMVAIACAGIRSRADSHLATAPLLASG